MTKKRFITIFILFFILTISPNIILAQAKENVWKTLAKVTFRKEMDADLGFKIDVPVFGKEPRMLDGKIVELRGYVLPTEGYKNQRRFMFSSLPYNVCFFCGGAGPETVMEVSSKQPIPVSKDPIMLRGRLQLNSGDVNKLMYSLTEAEIVK